MWALGFEIGADEYLFPVLKKAACGINLTLKNVLVYSFFKNLIIPYNCSEQVIYLSDIARAKKLV